MTMSAPRWSARALECASAKALGLCQTSSAGGVYSPRARAWADGDVRLRGPRLPGGYRRPLRRRWRRPAPSPPPRRPRRRWRGVAGGGDFNFICCLQDLSVLVRPGADGEGRAVQRPKVPRQAGSRVDRSSGAKRMGRVRISARGALLSVGPPSCPECAGSGTAACRSVRAGLLFDCLSALVRDQRWASKRQDPAHACSEVPSTFGRRGPRCGEGAPIVCAAHRMRPEGRGRRLADPDSGEEEGDPAPGTACARRRARDGKADQQSISPTPTPSPITTPISADRSGRRGCRCRAARSGRAAAASARTARGDARTLMPLAARLRPGHRAAAVTVGSRSAASRWGTCHASTEADWSPIKRRRT